MLGVYLQLDGETNLKPRRALKATLGIQHEEDIEHSEFLIDSEPPHANLYSYNGVLKYYTKEQTPGREHPIIEHEELKPKMEKKEAITINELLLRGCAIRNTTWVIGLVVYTGADTKIMLNQGEFGDGPLSLIYRIADLDVCGHVCVQARHPPKEAKSKKKRISTSWQISLSCLLCA